jgi:hypothetical protein
MGSNPFHRQELIEAQRAAMARRGRALKNRHARALEHDSVSCETGEGRSPG